jgi:hypothetical protein
MTAVTCYPSFSRTMLLVRIWSGPFVFPPPSIMGKPAFILNARRYYCLASTLELASRIRLIQSYGIPAGFCDGRHGFPLEFRAGSKNLKREDATKVVEESDIQWLRSRKFDGVVVTSYAKARLPWLALLTKTPNSVVVVLCLYQAEAVAVCSGNWAMGS